MSSGSESTDGPISFFVVGDTHYCVDANNPKTLASNSAQYNSQLVNQLNQLPGTLFTPETGGAAISKPRGVIHVGDIVDNGDKGPSKFSMSKSTDPR
ncbi:hypothetical protein SH501x_001873 [Pirellulaceae bacterium SH501]